MLNLCSYFQIRIFRTLPYVLKNIILYRIVLYSVKWICKFCWQDSLIQKIRWEFSYSVYWKANSAISLV